MTPTRQQALRKILRQHPDGLTANQLETLVPFSPSDIRRSLSAMPDVFVDRWVKGGRGQYEKVWCAVHVPANCPHPKDRPYRYVPPRSTFVGGASPWSRA